MVATLNQLGNTLLAQLYETVTGGDAHVPPSKNKFISWCCPGLPFQPQDFQFCVKGLGGGANAEQDKLLVNQAFTLATLADLIPDREGVYNNSKQQTVWSSSEARMSHMYREILNASRVVKQNLSKEEQAKIDKFRKLLRTTKKVKDLITDEEKEVTEDSPVLQAYNEKLAAYTDAALLYNSKRVAAQGATGVEGKTAVADWTNNATLYRLKVKSAMDAWVSGGYRNEVDEMNAYINQATQRSMTAWRQRLLEYYDDGVVSGLAPGQEFRFTTLVPGSFATAGGWTGQSTTHEHVSHWSSKSSNKWGGSAGVNFGLFSFGASAGGESSKFNSGSSVSTFNLSYELAQVIISRPWFYPEFFMNRGWTLSKGHGWNFDAMPSDGNLDNPHGLLIGYPTSILFARNIKIVSQEFSSFYSEYSKSVGGGGSIGFGPFCLGGNYSTSKSGNRFESTTDGTTLTVPGLQIIGFVNYLIGKAPNPLPELKPNDFE